MQMLAAERFCQVAHKGQVRKYTGIPYWAHPFEVSAMIRKVWPIDEDAQIVALLHDVIEDTKYTSDDIAEYFGTQVASDVEMLTNTPKQDGTNRAARKAIDRARLAQADQLVQTVKVADCISNTRDIAAADPAFAKVYMREINALLDVLAHAEPSLMAIARRQLNKYFASEMHDIYDSIRGKS